MSLLKTGLRKKIETAEGLEISLNSLKIPGLDKSVLLQVFEGS